MIIVRWLKKYQHLLFIKRAFYDYYHKVLTVLAPYLEIKKALVTPNYLYYVKDGAIYHVDFETLAETRVASINMAKIIQYPHGLLVVDFSETGKRVFYVSGEKVTAPPNMEIVIDGGGRELEEMARSPLYSIHLTPLAMNRHCVVYLAHDRRTFFVTITRDRIIYSRDLTVAIETNGKIVLTKIPREDAGNYFVEDTCFTRKRKNCIPSFR